ncbi:hypothetical protein BG910_04705 [Neisseria chenwenguii]|uniref:Uncharacterized protein n=1 Tax=Neisseria chenwenguii TaxID=1853278 RepID=A0A220S147_9NEIS|nr:hypothetical protein [Neisseria chenwenguii]ASK27132.1 hypothetical protein BG910_04705 [Neisseria chenwenguii]
MQTKNRKSGIVCLIREKQAAKPALLLNSSFMVTSFFLSGNNPLLKKPLSFVKKAAPIEAAKTALTLYAEC